MRGGVVRARGRGGQQQSSQGCWVCKHDVSGCSAPLAAVPTQQYARSVWGGG
jgi:hypothetical protein